jgi:hypothetical protein
LQCKWSEYTGSNIADQAREMKIVLEVKFPVGKNGNSVRLRAAAAVLARGVPLTP